MTQLPPDDLPQQLMVPMMDLPTPQSLSWDSVAQPDGSKIARIFVLNSHVTTLVLLDAESGMRLSDGLREIFSGIQIVHDLPASNGQGPLPGPLGLA